MEFEVFNKANSSCNRVDDAPRVSFTKNGCICLNKAALEVTGIGESLRCEFLKAKDGSWYVCGNGDNNSFDVRIDPRTGAGKLNCALVANELMKDGKSTKYDISRTAVKNDIRTMYYILTPNPITINQIKRK